MGEGRGLYTDKITTIKMGYWIPKCLKKTEDACVYEANCSRIHYFHQCLPSIKITAQRRSLSSFSRRSELTISGTSSRWPIVGSPKKRRRVVREIGKSSILQRALDGFKPWPSGEIYSRQWQSKFASRSLACFSEPNQPDDIWV